MAESARLGYLQARLQARHGQRPGEDEWRLVESSIDLLHYIDAVRATVLKRWVRGISPDSSAAEMERSLRASWRDRIVEVSAWAPSAWQDSLLWCRWLPELPALGHLLAGGEVRPWMQADPVASTYALQPPAACRDAIASSELAPMQHAVDSEGDVWSAWLRVWHGLMPDDQSGQTGQAMSRLEHLLEAHRQRMLAADAAADGQGLRRQWGEQLIRIFRHASGTVAALFAFLGLEALELERLRAGLVTRRLLKRVPEGLTWA